MEPQRERLPVWVTTYLDDSKANGELDPFSMYVLMIYGDRQFCADRAERFNQRMGQAEGYVRIRQRLVDELIAYADELIPQIPDEIRPGIIRSAILDMNLTLRETAQWICGWAIEDACEGGALMSYRRPPRPNVFRAWWPGKKMRRRVLSPRFMRNYSRKISEIDRLRLSGQRMLRFAQAGRIGTLHEEQAVFDILETQADSTLPEPEYRRELLAWAAKSHGGRVLRGRPKKLAQRNVRRRLSRAATLAASLIGPRAVGQFIRGESIELAGPNITFLVARQAGQLIQSGHGCLSLAAKASDGTPLGALCFYIEETPTLDQLAALALHVESGTEREVLAISNIIIPASAGVNHPLMVERRVGELAALIEAPEPPRSRNPANHRINHNFRVQEFDPRRIVEERRNWYWQETGPIWESILKTAVFGPAAAQWDLLQFSSSTASVSVVVDCVDLALVA